MLDLLYGAVALHFIHEFRCRALFQQNWSLIAALRCALSAPSALISAPKAQLVTCLPKAER